MPDPIPTATPEPSPSPAPTPDPSPTPSPAPAPTQEPQAPTSPAPVPEVALDYSGLTAPEILHLEAADLDAVKALAAEHKLSPAGTAALITKLGEQQAALLEAYNNEAAEAGKKQAAEWLEAAKADPTIGGQAFEANFALVNGVLNKFADEPFRKWLDETGLRNFPPLLRLFVGVAKATGEAPLLNGLPPPAPKARLYENSPGLYANQGVN